MAVIKEFVQRYGGGSSGNTNNWEDTVQRVQAVRNERLQQPVTFKLTSGKTITTSREKYERLRGILEENNQRIAELRAEETRLNRSLPVILNNEVTGSVRLGQDIANRRWNLENAGQNVVDIARNSNRGKYGVSTGILASPLAAPTEFLGHGYDIAKAGIQEQTNKRNLENTNKIIQNARKLKDEGKISQEQYVRLLSGFNKATEIKHENLPTTKEVLGSAAMTIAEALAVTKFAKALGKVDDLVRAGNVVDQTVTTGDVIKDLKTAEKAARATAGTKLTRSQIIKNLLKEGGKAGIIGATGAGGLSAADNASNEDIIKSTAVGTGLGFVLGSGASGVSSTITNKIANKAQNQADRLNVTIKEVQDTFNDNKSRKRIAGALVKNGNLEEAKLVLNGNFSKSQLQEITDVLNTDNRQIIQGAGTPARVVNEPIIKTTQSVDNINPTKIKEITGYNTRVIPEQPGFVMTKQSNELPDIVNRISEANITDGSVITKEIDNLVNLHKTQNGWLTQAVGKVPGLNKVARLIEGRNTIIKNFGEAGTELSARADVAELLKEQYRGQVESFLSDVRKQNGMNYKKVLTQAIDQIKTATTPEARASLKGAARQIADLQDMRRQAFINSGIDIGFREGYFTDMIKPGMEGEAKDYIKRAITDKLNIALKNGDEATLQAFGLNKNSTAADIKDAVLREADGSITSLNIMRNKKGQIRAGIEYSKSNILPKKYYETDPEVILASWNDETAKRLSSSQVFGKSDEVTDTLLNRISDEYGAGAKKYALDMIEKQRYGAPTSAATPIMRGVRSYNMLSKMGLSAITNAGQVSNKYTMFGGSKTLGAYADVIKNWSKYVKVANERGIGLTEITDELMEKVYAKGKKNIFTTASGKILTYNGFKTVETMHRLADIKLADDLMVKMEKKGLNSKFSKDWMRRLDLNADEITKQGLTEANKKAITRQVVGAIDFYVDPKDIAAWTTSGEVGKTISQLGKFGLKQGGHIAKQVIGEASHGNLAPLLRWMVGTQVVGASVTAAKSVITGKKRENSLSDAVSSMSEALQELEQGDTKGAWEALGDARQYAGENLARAGGLGYAYDTIKSAEYGNTPQEKILNMLGPTGSTVNSILKAGQNLSEGDTEKAIREGSKVLPFQNIWGPNYDRITGDNLFTFDPKGGKVYDFNKTLPEEEQLKVSRDDADAFGKAARKGNVSNSPVIEQIAKKLYDYKGNEKPMDPKTRAAFNKFLSEYGITNAKDIAANAYKQSYERTKAIGKAGDSLSEEEKVIKNKYGTSDKAQKYLESIGKSINDYPGLKRYYEAKDGKVNYSITPKDMNGLLTGVSKQVAQREDVPGGILGTFILGLKTLIGQGPKDYEEAPTLIKEKYAGQPYGGFYDPSKNMITMVDQSRKPNKEAAEDYIFTHENAHADYKKLRQEDEARLAINRVIENYPESNEHELDPEYIDNRFLRDLRENEPGFYNSILKMLNNSALYGYGKKADIASELYAYLSTEMPSDKYISDVVYDAISEGKLPTGKSNILAETLRKYYK